MITSYFRFQYASKQPPLFPRIHSYAFRHNILSPYFHFLLYQPGLLAQNKYGISQFGDETGTFFTQPLRWQGGDWPKLGIMGAGTFLVIQADQPIRTAVLKDQSYYYSVPMVGGRVWGDLYTPVALFTLFGAHSIITGDNTTRNVAFEIGQASLYAGAIAFMLKGFIGRARPYTDEDRASYHPFSMFSNDDKSMPGGRSAAALVLSTVLSRSAKPVWLKGVAYLPAVLTFISRVYQDQHWTSDDFIGAALGNFVATWVVDHHEQEDNRIGVSSISPFTVRIILN